jgi:hypothetical protein
MDVDSVGKEMDRLENSWFEAHRAAITAQQELAGKSSPRIGVSILSGLLGGIVAVTLTQAVLGRGSPKSQLQSAQRRLEEAGLKKKKIMHEIETLEDSLLL